MSKIQNSKFKIQNLIFLFSLSSLIFTLCFAQDSSDYVKMGWTQLGKRNFEQVYKITDECIEKFSFTADDLAKDLAGFPPKGKESFYQIMNDVATCYFIKGEALMREGRAEEAKKVFREVIEKYPYAYAWDPRGWFWSIREKAQVTLKKLETGRIEEEEEEVGPVTRVTLYDEGEEFPVDYQKYGEFVGIGTPDYRYIIEDPVGLAKAVGEGVYPNTTSVRFDPNFIKVKKLLPKIDHWKILNSRDLSTAFYKWALAPESPGVRQFYIGDILERSGLIKQAIKAYYALIVNFPKTVGWTYWKTPWYVSKAALYRIKFLLENYPQLNLKLEGASIKVINGTDNNIRNDIFIVNPGKLVKKSLRERIFCSRATRKLGKIVASQGVGKVKLVRYESGDWQLLVEGKPFIIKGITYSPTRVGESPDEGTLTDWMTQDTNNNGLIDAPYEAWVDKNRNNAKDKDEKSVGDFHLMKQMGVNCLRLYHQPFGLNKQLLKEMYENYRIYVVIGDFLGKYALGSGASWEEGTDYDNPVHQENMLKSVRKMVEEFRDEPYVLMWLLGNENVYGVACNADKKPASFFKFANRAASLIKSLDPNQRPVAIASGDTLYLDIFGKNCPDIDIFGTNSYRGKYGFLDLWEAVRDLADKPIIVTEYGAPSYATGYSQEEAEEFQAEYHKNAWQDIYNNRAGHGLGNSLGGFAFEWLDEWWKAYEPSYHDKKGLFAGPFLDGYMHEEWLGICGQGDGRSSPFLRHLKKVYFTYKKLWRKN
jgi:beta-glucuronidase